MPIGAAGFNQGDHVTLLGPTGTGKTHMALTVAELRTYIIFLATKDRDPLIAELRRHGYQVQHNLELTYVDEKPEPRRIVYWPPLSSDKRTRVRQREQAILLQRALDQVSDDGGWCIIADETIWLTQNLRLERELNAIWFQGRTKGLSLVACAQRPAWVPAYAYSQAQHLFIWQTSDHRDLKRLGEIGSGIDLKAVQEQVRTLDRSSHEALYINTRTNEAFRVVAPAR